MSNGRRSPVRTGVALGRLAGRATAVALALYVVAFVYRAGGVTTAFALGGVVALYALASVARDLRYGYRPWDAVEWTTVRPGTLDPAERRRATRWTVALNGLLVVGAVGTLAGAFAVGLELLGSVLLVGGAPAFAVASYRHYANDTRPWYPSVPSRIVPG